MRIEDAFFLNFPQQASATTQTLWQNLALAAAGIELNTGKPQTSEGQTETIADKYIKYVNSQ